jgi:hypothetical protein
MVSDIGETGLLVTAASEKVILHLLSLVSSLIFA